MALEFSLSPGSLSRRLALVTTEVDGITQFALTLPVDQRAQMASALQQR